VFHREGSVAGPAYILAVASVWPPAVVQRQSPALLAPHLVCVACGQPSQSSAVSSQQPAPAPAPAHSTAWTLESGASDAAKGKTHRSRCYSPLLASYRQQQARVTSQEPGVTRVCRTRERSKALCRALCLSPTGFALPLHAGSQPQQAPPLPPNCTHQPAKTKVRRSGQQTDFAVYSYITAAWPPPSPSPRHHSSHPSVVSSTHARLLFHHRQRAASVGPRTDPRAQAASVFGSCTTRARG
jgi:hypothetical protein